MKPPRVSIPGLRSSIVPFLPLALWVLVWMGIKGGLVEEISNSESLSSFITRFRGALPLLAAFVAVAMIGVKLYRGRSDSIPLLGPLGFATIYGLVGLAAAFLSPDGSVALYWAAAYLSVPLVLWGIIWGKDGLASAQRIVRLNWLFITLAVGALFAIALLYLDLGALILTPSSWLDCELYGSWRGNSWHDLTSGILRPTGVGRYAAIAAILSLGALWKKGNRTLWAVILLVSLILLLTSGARGAYVGFAAGAALVIIFHGGKKAVAGSILAALVLVPLVWSTGVHEQFFDLCLSRQTKPSQATLAAQDTASPAARDTAPLLDLPIRVNIPAGPWILEQVSTGEQDSSVSSGLEAPKNREQDVSGTTSDQPPSAEKQTASDVFTRVLVPKGLTVEPTTANTPRRMAIPEGTWELKLLPEQQSGADWPLRLRLMPGLLELNQLAPGEILDRSLLILDPNTLGNVAFSGRVSVWEEGFKFFKQRPILGHGFHADRLLLGTHMHNTLMHALVQTGLAGTIPLVIGLLLAWVLLINALWHRASLPEVHRHLLIQVAGVVVFFSFRSVPESTGAFFGIDWLLLAPLLVYLQVVNRVTAKAGEAKERITKEGTVRHNPLLSWLRSPLAKSSIVPISLSKY